MKLRKKILSLILCGCMLVPMFTACANKENKNQLSWDMTEEDVVSLGMEIKNNENDTALVVTSDTDGFSSIEKEQIKLISYSRINESTEENSSVTETEITDFSVDVDSAKKLTITVSGGDSDVEGYLVAVHSSATDSGKFGEAIAFNTKADEIGEEVIYSASISDEYATGDSDPIITVTLENTIAAEELSKEMITLTGEFEDLEITKVSGSESTITIATSGTISCVAPFTASVELAKEATNSGVELVANCDISYRAIYVKQDSFALTDGALEFCAVISSDTFNLKINDTLVSNNVTYTVKAISEDKTEVTLSVATDANELDAAIDAINGNVLDIPADKVSSSIAHSVSVSAVKAGIGASIDYIEETDKANTYSATAILFIKNGEWVSEVTADDITFSGEFADAKVESVTKDGNSYEIVFAFVKEGLDIDNVELEGMLNVASNKIKNSWGTTVNEASTELCYITGLDRGEVWDTIKAFIDANKGTFDTIGTVGSAIGGVASAAGGVVKILELLDIVESTDDKLDNIKREIEYANQSIKVVDEKLSSLSQSMELGNADILSAVQKNTYITASNGWHSFMTSHVAPLSDVMSKYTLAYNTYMLNYINDAGKTDSITVYIDEKGKVTLPGTISGYAVDGTPIKSTVNCSLDGELGTIKQEIVNNKGRLYDGYWEDMTSLQVTIVDASGNPVSNITTKQYFEALQLDAAISAMNTTGASEILNTYTNFCNALAGVVGGSSSSKVGIKPLDYYYQMISMHYNFYIESKEDIAVTQAWLGGLLIESSGLATLAYEYTPGAEEGTVSAAYALALDELKNNTGAYEDKYCYVVGKKIIVDRVYESYKWSSQKLYLCTVPDYSYDYQVKNEYNFPTNYMNELNVRILLSRYEQMKKAKIVKSESFADYLVSLGYISEDLKNAVILVSKPGQQAMPMDNSVTLSVYGCSSHGDYFKNGDKVKIGSHGDIKSKYFYRANQLMGSVVNLKGQSSTERIIAIAEYNEDHWYWMNREWADLDMHISNPMLVFKLSE